MVIIVEFYIKGDISVMLAEKNRKRIAMKWKERAGVDTAREVMSTTTKIRAGESL